jgi:hypothetical protein
MLALFGLQNSLYPGEAGWGDVLFVAIWVFGTLLLAAYYVYRAFVSR